MQGPDRRWWPESTARPWFHDPIRQRRGEAVFLGNNVCLQPWCVSGTAASSPGPAHAPGGSRPGSHTGPGPATSGSGAAGKERVVSTPNLSLAQLPQGTEVGVVAGVLMTQKQKLSLTIVTRTAQGPSGVFSLWTLTPHAAPGLVALRSWCCRSVASSSLSGTLGSELNF